LFLAEVLEITSNRLAFLVYGQGDLEKSLDSLKYQNNNNWKAVVLDSVVSASASQQISYVDIEKFNINAYIKKNNISYVGLLKSGDHLPKHAVNRILEVIENKNIKVLYSDLDFDDKSGRRSKPWFKPDWDYELFLSQNYLNELFVVKSENIPNNYDVAIELLPLYCIKNLLENQVANSKSIHHIPEVLYHKNKGEKASADLSLSQKSSQVIQTILDQIEPGSLVKKQKVEPSLRRIKRTIQNRPLVSIIIPTRDQVKLLKRCIKTLLDKTAYTNYEVLIVDNQSRESKTLKYFKKLEQIENIRILDYPKQFNYSAINNYAVSKANGEVIALVNNDIEFKDQYWLDEMLGLLLREQVGAVGCKLIWPNGMVQHGGVVLGVNGLADHAFNTISADEPGYYYRAMVTQQYSAVTAACLLTRKKDYLAVDGLNEVDFPVAFNDVDYCLKLRQQGKRIVWTPFVDIIHAESASRGSDNSPEKMARAQKEMNNLKQKWGYELMHDPFYNPNLNLDHLSGPFNGLAIPPRTLFK